MIKVNIEIELFDYNDLEDKAKQKAKDEHFNFLCEICEDKEATEESIYDSVEESIEINEYLFFEDGNMANTTKFTGEHEKTGQREFYLYGKTYNIK